MIDIFFEIHKDLPREGPGDAASTLKVFRLMEHLPAHPHILDVGCGPGMQTIELANHMDGSIETHQPFLDRLQERFSQQPLRSTPERRQQIKL